MKHVETKSMKARVGSVIAAGAFAASTMLSPMMAFAAVDNTVNEPTQLPAGDTQVFIQTIDTSEVHVSDENLTFTIPNEIDFVAKADGTLLGPDCYIENDSQFGIHTTGMTSAFEAGWNPVALSDVADTAVTARDTIGYTIGPDADPLDAATHAVDRDDAASNVAVANAWNMKAKDTTGNADRVNMSTTGKIKNVDKQIQGKTKVGTLTWYVTPGNVA